MLREGTDPSEPERKPPLGAPRWVHSWLYRRSPPPPPPPPPLPPPMPATSPATIHPRHTPAPPTGAFTALIRVVLVPPLRGSLCLSPCRRRHPGTGDGGAAASGSASTTTARDTHYPPLTNHLDHRLRIAECLARAAGIPLTEFLPLLPLTGLHGRLSIRERKKDISAERTFCAICHHVSR
jgi:hypothetical protein